MRVRFLLRNLFRKRVVEQALDDELQSSLELLVEAKIREGFSPADARKQALIEIGGVEQVKEEVRSSRIGHWIEDFGRDLRYGIWTLGKKPGFTVVALVVLGLGIGANTAIFSIVNAFLFRPLPVHAPEELVSIYASFEGGQPRGTYYGPMTYSTYLDIREQEQVFSGVASFGLTRLTLLEGESRETLQGQAVSGNFFDVLGVRLPLGRGFLREEGERPNTPPVVVISHSLWKRRFNSAPDVIGKVVKLNGHGFTVVGVTPPDFKGLWIPGLSIQLYIPAPSLGLIDSQRALPDYRQSLGLVIGRLKPGVSLKQAAAVMDTKARQLGLPGRDPHEILSFRVLRTDGIRILPMPTGDLIPKWISLALMLVVAIVLLIAGANLAGLIMARSITRRREIAVRLALGAGRFRIVRQLLAENLLLSSLGAVGGLLLAQALVSISMSYVPVRVASSDISLDVPLDLRVLLFTVLLSIATGVFVGLAPALRASRINLVSSLTAESIVIPHKERRRLRHWIIIPQISMSLALLLLASLFVRTLVKTELTSPGFETSRQAIILPEDLNGYRYTSEQGRDFYRRLLERAEAVPGVDRACIASTLPLSMDSRLLPRVMTESELAAGQGGRIACTTQVSPGYFQTMSIPILRGRDFASGDRRGGPDVAIISESAARSLWPGQEPIGRRMALQTLKNRLVEVVGVAGDVRSSLSEQSNWPIVYLPLEQNYYSAAHLVVRCSGNPAAMLGRLTDLVHEVDEKVQVVESMTMADSISLIFFPLRMGAGVVLACGVVGLFLVMVGLYGVIAYSVAHRTREIGIRAALGAQKTDIIRMVVGETLWVVGAGSVFGLILALAANRLLSASGLFFGTLTLDPLVFAGIALLIGAVVLLAAYVPARRAARVDPMQALRES